MRRRLVKTVAVALPTLFLISFAVGYLTTG